MVKYLVVAVGLTLMVSCMKEHLEPPDHPNPDPLIYIIANLNGDSISFAGGLNSYVGSSSVSDTLSNRTFNFTLKNPQTPGHSYFQISINNYKNELGELQQDLDHTIYPDSRHYQDAIHFIPLAASVDWHDASGVKFSSALSLQTQPFIINTVEDVVFENKHYKKTAVEFECNLSDGHGHVLHLTHGRAVILF